MFSHILSFSNGLLLTLIPHKRTILPRAFEMMVSMLLPAVNGSTIFNLSDMLAKHSDADDNYTNQHSKANVMKFKEITNEK